MGTTRVGQKNMLFSHSFGLWKDLIRESVRNALGDGRQRAEEDIPQVMEDCGIMRRRSCSKGYLCKVM